jgi:hypothetical protein
MCWDLIFLLTLSIISLVFAISDGSVRPLLSRHLIIDLFETEGDLLEFHVEQHQALSTKSIVALKHRGDDALTNQHDAVSVHNSASDSDSDPASVSSESHLFASATPNIHASLEENLRRVVKFLGEMVPVSLFDVKRDGHEVQLNALVRSFNEDLNTKPLRLRHSDEETPRRCLRATSPLQIQIPVDESIVISPETLAVYAVRGRGKKIDISKPTDWIIVSVCGVPIVIFFLVFCFACLKGTRNKFRSWSAEGYPCSWPCLRHCFLSGDPIPASTEPPHELR